MVGTAEPRRKVEYSDFFQSIDHPHKWYKLPLRVMADVGPAVQTFAGLLKLTKKATFRQQREIASCARLPLATVKKHLVTLHERGWIENEGRQRTAGGILRRTATLTMTKKALAALAPDEPYGVLPWQAMAVVAVMFTNGKRWNNYRLPWSAKAVLSVVLSRLMSIIAGAKKQKDAGKIGEDCRWEMLKAFGGIDRFRFGLDELHRLTGLGKPAIIAAKRTLKKIGMVDWVLKKRDDGGSDRDALAPHHGFSFQVEESDTPGKCWVRFLQLWGV